MQSRCARGRWLPLPPRLPGLLRDKRRRRAAAPGASPASSGSRPAGSRLLRRTSPASSRPPESGSSYKRPPPPPPASGGPAHGSAAPPSPDPATSSAAPPPQLPRPSALPLASAMGMPSPVAYKLRRGAPRGLLARGMNFAVGGSGVLDTGNFQRNLSAQIDLFQAQGGCGSTGTGVALVVVSGNDYSYAADKDNGTSAAIAYIPTVVRRLREQLRRLRDEAGMRRVVVTNLHPMGCTPIFTRPLNYTGCDPLANMGSAQHNAALRSVLADLDPGNRTFLLLDLNTPFAAFVESSDDDESIHKRFPSPLRPCCESFSPDGYCGQQDDNGNRQYTLCDDPGRHFYWDDVHPTQAAWAAVADTFRATIQDFLST